MEEPTSVYFKTRLDFDKENERIESVHSNKYLDFMQIITSNQD